MLNHPLNRHRRMRRRLAIRRKNAPIPVEPSKWYHDKWFWIVAATVLVICAVVGGIWYARSRRSKTQPLANTVVQRSVQFVSEKTDSMDESTIIGLLLMALLVLHSCRSQSDGGEALEQPAEIPGNPVSLPCVATYGVLILLGGLMLWKSDAIMADFPISNSEGEMSSEQSFESDDLSDRGSTPERPAYHDPAPSTRHAGNPVVSPRVVSAAPRHAASADIYSRLLRQASHGTQAPERGAPPAASQSGHSSRPRPRLKPAKAKKPPDKPRVGVGGTGRSKAPIDMQSEMKKARLRNLNRGTPAVSGMRRPGNRSPPRPKRRAPPQPPPSRAPVNQLIKTLSGSPSGGMTIPTGEYSVDQYLQDTDAKVQEGLKMNFTK